MKVLSTNIAQPKTFIWKGKTVKTGIYKNPTNGSIFLGKEDVLGDEVSDRKVHGGEFKACYLFSADHYSYWKNLYPNLDWSFGMLGENLTIQGLDEKQLYIGDVYKLGNALVQITQPREPCFKLGVKFKSQDVLKQFIDYGHPGTYIRILKEGEVTIGDTLDLVEKCQDSISVWDFFQLLYSEEKNKDQIKSILENDALPQGKRDRLKLFLQ